MNPKDRSQTPDKINQVLEDNVTGVQNHEQDKEHNGTETNSMTIEERQAKLQQLRAKMVSCVSSP